MNYLNLKKNLNFRMLLIFGKIVKILNLHISQKWLEIEQNGPNFGSHALSMITNLKNKIKIAISAKMFKYFK